MPVFNEASTLPDILGRLDNAALPMPWELIVVDDGSTDRSVDCLAAHRPKTADEVWVTTAPTNRGKGAAIRRGLELAKGQVVGVQDADLEYAPTDIPDIIELMERRGLDAAFGSRQFGPNAAYSFWYAAGNRALSLLASALFDRLTTDAYTCYKFLRRDLLERLRLRADGFEIEAELTAQVLRFADRYGEVAISYEPRTRDQGKKISPSDGLVGAMTLVRQRIALG